MSELRAGWMRATIPELVCRDGIFSDGDWVESEDQDPNGDVRLIQLADIGDGRYINKSNRFMTTRRASELRCTHLRTGDILIARMPEPLGRACIFPGDRKLAVTVVDVCIVRGRDEDFDAAWLIHFINSPDFRDGISSRQSGSTRKRISKGNLSTLAIPVPPRAEQTRITTKLEELLSDLDAGVAELKAAQQKLQRYRQSLLKAAVEGALNAEWRQENPPTETGAELLQRILRERRARWEEQQLAKFAAQSKAPPKGWKDKYPEPQPPKAEGLPALPEGWVWASVDQCARDEAGITDGPFGSNLKSEHYTATGPRVVRLQNIGDGAFIAADAHIDDSRYKALTKHWVEDGDVVSAMLGETLPRACAVPEGFAPGIVKADCARIRPNTELVPSDWLVAVLNAEPTRRRVSQSVKGVGRPRINLGDLRSVAVPIPPRREQVEILAVLELALSAADDQSAAINRSLAYSAAQRQNVLRAAFRGELVSQDPNDEPAIALLARLRAERGETVQSSRKNRRIGK